VPRGRIELSTLRFSDVRTPRPMASNYGLQRSSVMPDGRSRPLKAPRSACRCEPLQS
jgi:hypothetical protein